jgi:hypothetical protein
MKIARVKSTVNNGKITFELKDVDTIAIDKVVGIEDNLKRMNMQRYLLRRNKTAKIPSLVGKRFK